MLSGRPTPISVILPHSASPLPLAPPPSRQRPSSLLSLPPSLTPPLPAFPSGALRDYHVTCLVDDGPVGRGAGQEDGARRQRADSGLVREMPDRE